jgi:hypothetical protein
MAVRTDNLKVLIGIIAPITIFMVYLQDLVFTEPATFALLSAFFHQPVF